MQYLLVPGRPVPKAWGKVKFHDGLLRYTPDKTVKFEKHVKTYGQKARLKRMQGELATAMLFYTNHPGDVDNMVKSIHDALKGVAYEDDSQVKDYTASKLPCPRGQEKTEVVIMELEKFRELVDLRKIIAVAREGEEVKMPGLENA